MTVTVGQDLWCRTWGTGDETVDCFYARRCGDGFGGGRLPGPDRGALRGGTETAMATAPDSWTPTKNLREMVVWSNDILPHT